MFVWSEIKTKKRMKSRENFVLCDSLKDGGDVARSLEKTEKTIVAAKEPPRRTREEIDA